MHKPAFTQPYGVSSPGDDGGSYTVRGIPNQHVLNNDEHRKSFTIVEAITAFDVRSSAPAEMLRRSGALDYMLHGGQHGFVPPQVLDADGRVPFTAVASYALLIIQATD